MKILITGGAGYIGTELVHQLAANRDVKKVVIYDSLSRGNYNLFIGNSSFDPGKLRFVQGELLDTRKLKKEVEQADVVFHLAAKATTPFADHNPHEFDQINNWGTSELTYLVEASNVKRFIYLSSISVYGSSTDLADVETPINPSTFYGISKAKGEDHVKRLIDSGTQTYIFRCGNVYGYSKSMRLDSVINKFLFEAHYSNRIRIFGDGDQKRSFIHIDRLSAFLGRSVFAKAQEGIYNLVESTFSINEVVDELKTLYPTLEMTFVNQNMKMRNLIVSRDERLPELMRKETQLKEDLQKFKNQFSF